MFIPGQRHIGGKDGEIGAGYVQHEMVGPMGILNGCDRPIRWAWQRIRTGPGHVFEYESGEDDLANKKWHLKMERGAASGGMFRALLFILSWRALAFGCLPLLRAVGLLRCLALHGFFLFLGVFALWEVCAGRAVMACGYVGARGLNWTKSWSMGLEFLLYGWLRWD